MAQLKKKYFGNLSGRFGDAVFRQLGDKNYIAQRPANYKVPDTPEFRDRITKFGFAAKLAKSVYRTQALQTFWKREYPVEIRMFNFILQTNYSFINPDGISSTPLIVPEVSGFGVNLNTASISDRSVRVNIDPLGSLTGIDETVETQIQLISILLLANPVDINYPKFHLFPLQSEEQRLSLNDPLVFDMVLSSNQSEKVQRYQKRKALFALVTLDNNSSLVNYSLTFYSA
jgi:hypothetical protein